MSSPSRIACLLMLCIGLHGPAGVRLAHAGARAEPEHMINGGFELPVLSGTESAMLKLTFPPMRRGASMDPVGPDRLPSRMPGWNMPNLDLDIKLMRTDAGRAGEGRQYILLPPLKKLWLSKPMPSDPAKYVGTRKIEAPAEISQQIGTVPGQVYTLRWLHACDAPPGGKGPAYQVWWNERLLFEQQAPRMASGQERLNWQAVEIPEIEAESRQTRLRFLRTDLTTHGLALDAVSLQLDPVRSSEADLLDWPVLPDDGGPARYLRSVLSGFGDFCFVLYGHDQAPGFERALNTLLLYQRLCPILVLRPQGAGPLPESLREKLTPGRVHLFEVPGHLPGMEVLPRIAGVTAGQRLRFDQAGWGEGIENLLPPFVTSGKDPQLVFECLFSEMLIDSSGHGNALYSNYECRLVPDRFGVARSAMDLGRIGSVFWEKKAALRDLTQYTVSMWFKTGRDFLDGPHIGQGDFGDWTGANLLLRPGPGEIGLGFSKVYVVVVDHATDRKGALILSKIRPHENDWKHVALTRDRSTITLYANGRKVGSTPSPQDVPVSVPASRLGYTENNWSIDGQVDDLRIFSRALSHEEVLGLYHEGGWDR